MAIDTEERTNQPQKSTNDTGTNKPKSNNNKKIITIVIVVVVALFVLGVVGNKVKNYIASKTADTIVDKVSGGHIKSNSSKGKMTIRGDDGDSVDINTSEKTLPDGFPSEVPVYKGAKIVSSSSFKSGDGKMYSVVLSTKDSPEKVNDFYKTAFDKNGWKTSTTMDTNGMYMVRSQNKSKNISGGATTTKDDGQTKIVLSATTDFAKEQD